MSVDSSTGVQVSYIRNAARRVTGLAYGNGIFQTQSLSKAGLINGIALLCGQTLELTSATSYSAGGAPRSQALTAGDTTTTTSFGYDGSARVSAQASSMDLRRPRRDHADPRLHERQPGEPRQPGRERRLRDHDDAGGALQRQPAGRPDPAGSGDAAQPQPDRLRRRREPDLGRRDEHLLQRCGRGLLADRHDACELRVRQRREHHRRHRGRAHDDVLLRRRGPPGRGRPRREDGRLQLRRRRQPRRPDGDRLGNDHLRRHVVVGSERPGPAARARARLELARPRRALHLRRGAGRDGDARRHVLPPHRRPRRRDRALGRERSRPRLVPLRRLRQRHGDGDRRDAGAGRAAALPGPAPRLGDGAVRHAGAQLRPDDRQVHPARFGRPCARRARLLAVRLRARHAHDQSRPDRPRH